MNRIREMRRVTEIRMDKRIRKTRTAIREAFVRLMQKKEYDAITVTDISEEAEINRKTFYAHYETKEALYAQIVEEMFFELFSSFMYEKQAPDGNLNMDLLHADIAEFFGRVERYRQALDTLISGRTMGMAFEIADAVICSELAQIHVLTDVKESVIPAELLVGWIRNFFFTAIDWWLEQTQYTREEAAGIYAKLMRKSMVNIFRYQQMQSVRI